MANKYSEELFGAIDEILRVRLQSLNKDITILCNIEDTTNAEDGEYIVSNSGMRFSAYSDKTTYTLGQRVWVLVPDGDYENTKMIIGRYVSADSVAFNYVDPFSSFIDMSGNICDEENVYTKVLGLVANEIDEGQNPEAQRKYFNNGNSIISQSISIDSLQGLARIGVSADFMVGFSDNPPISGSYGLHFICTTDKKSSVAEDSYNKLEFNLDSSEMQGSIYSNTGYWTQKKIIDFSPEDDGNITSIVCYFYQNADFYTMNGNAYP